MAPGALTPACMRWARSRMSTLSAHGTRSGSARASTPCSSLTRSRSSAPNGPAPSSTPGAAPAPATIVIGSSTAAPRSRSSVAAPGGLSPLSTPGRCTRPPRRWSAGTISPPFAIRNARRNRRSAPWTGSRSCATATRSSSKPPRSRSCTARCARWSARSSKSARAAGARASLSPRSKPPTAGAAARSRRLLASLSSASTMRPAALAPPRAKTRTTGANEREVSRLLRRRGLGEIALERALVDQRERLEIVERDPLVERVDGGVDEAEFDDWTGVLDEARVGGSSAGRKLGPPPGHVLNRGGDKIGEPPRPGQEGHRVGRVESQRRARAHRGDPPGNLCTKRFGRPEIVEADVEGESDLARNDVRRRVADIDAGDFEVRRLEVSVALVERRRDERRQQGRQRPDRILRDPRIGDMALAAADREPAVKRAAPAVFDRVAERADAGRLADNAMVETLAPGERPVEELDRAVDRRTFLVAGDEEADRALKRPLGDEAQGCGHSGGDAALHVAGAPAPEFAVGNLGCERIKPPALNIAGRDDVGMAGEGEIGPSGSEPGMEVQDRRRARRLEREELGCESRPRQEIAEIRQRPAVVGGDRPATDERARDLERRGRRRHPSP